MMFRDHMTHALLKVDLGRFRPDVASITTLRFLFFHLNNGVDPLYSSPD
jgi:hypothetical protein